MISRRTAIASGIVSAVMTPAAAQTAERPTVINAHHTR